MRGLSFKSSAASAGSTGNAGWLCPRLETFGYKGHWEVDVRGLLRMVQNRARGAESREPSEGVISLREVKLECDRVGQTGYAFEEIQAIVGPGAVWIEDRLTSFDDLDDD